MVARLHCLQTLPLLYNGSGLTVRLMTRWMMGRFHWRHRDMNQNHQDHEEVDSTKSPGPRNQTKSRGPRHHDCSVGPAWNCWCAFFSLQKQCGPGGLEFDDICIIVLGICLAYSWLRNCNEMELGNATRDDARHSSAEENQWHTMTYNDENWVVYSFCCFWCVFIVYEMVHFSLTGFLLQATYHQAFYRHVYSTYMYHYVSRHSNI